MKKNRFPGIPVSDRRRKRRRCTAPPYSPGSTKLGRERTRICPEAVTGEGILASSYRSRKLLDRYLEIAALKYGLSLEEIRMIMFLDHCPARSIQRKIWPTSQA